MSSEQTLYIVATPIGNRDDISARAIQVLRHVDRIYAEDTRHSLPLLRHHGIETRLWPLHEHNEQTQVQVILDHLRSPATAALITDAGTPLISDPGYRLVRACRNAGITVSPIPGACALTAALSVAGLPTDRFEFVGFPPNKSSARETFLRALVSRTHTLIFYESPHRIVDCLRDVARLFGEQRPVAVTRELTKRFETVLFGTAESVLETVEADHYQQKGEFVVIIGAPVSAQEGESDHPDVDRLLAVLMQHLPVKTAARCVAEIEGLNKKQVYARALTLQGR